VPIQVWLTQQLKDVSFIVILLIPTLGTDKQHGHPSQSQTPPLYTAPYKAKMEKQWSFNGNVSFY
jgi:hypothetical protein